MPAPHARTDDYFVPGDDGAPAVSTATVASIGDWVCQQIEQLDLTQIKDQEYVARQLIHSMLGLPGEKLAALIAELASAGSPQWDAFVQSLVAWRCQTADPKIPTPDWANETHLDEAWAPFGRSIRDDGRYTLSVLSTPAAFLHRGVVLSRSNLKEL